MPEYDANGMPIRRRPRKKKPKWKRMLHKYSPTIRFGVICLALLLVLSFCVKGLVTLVATAVENFEFPTVPPVETTEPPPPTLSPEEWQELAEQTGAQAEKMSLGYDYLGAIELIQSFERYQDYDFLTEAITKYQQLDSQLVPYENMANVTHVFFHSLIVDVERCFDGDKEEKGYNQYMTTCDEFWAILEEMYARGFVLVSPYDVAYEVTTASGYSYFTYGEIRLPEGKTPFMMSQDDLNYYGYMIGDGDGKGTTPAYVSVNGDGFAHKLVLDENGKVTCEYMDANGNILYGDYDLVPLLEKFIEEHPDFSYHGARAMLGVTGYEGVFGYRTKPSYEEAMGSENYQKEVEEAKKIAEALKSQGFLVVSHSYGHPAYGEIEAYNVQVDSDKWEDTVQPIVGETDIILYPHGSDIAGTNNYTFSNSKFVYLYEDGYRYFFNVDSAKYWVQLGENYYRASRRNLDGYRMYYYPKRLADLFDVDAVFDEARTTPVPKLY